MGGFSRSLEVELSAGNAYNFPLYFSILKSVLGFNQQQVTLLGVANDIGENVGFLLGIACNKFLHRAVVLLIGVVLCFFGYCLLWLNVSQTIETLPFWLSLKGLLSGMNCGVDCLEILIDC
ncbi:hypothetical protein Dsin_013233 [Dipteronia sinensis]|uniref:Nodulin-like domain-containing protein n=1 Tax=Dipteronia sinensis TaxID=43782 RepID=A0AAE0E8P8_9ROSI|nr:hypothetical protein Dsin_013233 [Dipteronia sinensis]